MTNKTNKIKLNKSQEVLVERILRYIEREERLPWESGVISNTNTLNPFNPVSKTKYTNTNLITLAITAVVEGYSDPRWMTFKQAKANGYTVKKGAKATPISYVSFYNERLERYLVPDDYKELTKQEVEELKYESRVHIRTYNVFNGNQIAGLPRLHDIEYPSVSFSNQYAKEFTSLLLENIKLEVQHEEGQQARYNPNDDKVILPLQEQFKTEEDYYATLLHEIAHATMHESRLNRVIDKDTEAYAKEELNAEFTSIFLSTDLGYVRQEQTIENHSAYIKSWEQAIYNDPNIIFKSVQSALQIRKYLHKEGHYDYDKALNMGPKTPEGLKGKLIAVEGNIGVGKTTLAQKLSEYYNAILLEEVFNEKILEKMYNLEYESLLDVELEFYHQRNNLVNEALKNNQDKLVIADFDVRKSMLFSSLTLTPEEQFAFNKVFTNTAIEENLPDLTIILEDSIENLQSKIARRARNGEDAITYDYLEALNKQYDTFETTWANKKNKVIRIGASQINLENMEEVIKEIEKTLNISTTKSTAQTSENTFDLETMKRDVLISEYAHNVLGFNITNVGNTQSTQEHDSLRIYKSNSYYRNSTHKGGSVIDFIMEFEEVDQKEAIKRLSKYYEENKPLSRKAVKTSKQKLPFVLPKPAKNNERVKTYLTKTRSIAPRIVDDLIKDGLIYQDEMGNCIFVGLFNGKPIAGARRGAAANNTFKGDVASSRKEAGFFVDNNSDTLIVNESVIDALSLMTIKTDYENFDYLSTNGVGTVVPAIDFHLGLRKKEEQYRKVIISLDNDRAGEDATVELTQHLKEKYPALEVTYQFPSPNMKDWNEELNAIAKKHEPSRQRNPELEVKGMLV